MPGGKSSRAWVSASGNVVPQTSSVPARRRSSSFVLHRLEGSGRSAQSQQITAKSKPVDGLPRDSRLEPPALMATDAPPEGHTAKANLQEKGPRTGTLISHRDTGLRCGG